VNAYSYRHSPTVSRVNRSRRDRAGHDSKLRLTILTRLVRLTRKRKLCAKPGKFTIAEPRRQRNLAARFLGDLHPEVHVSAAPGGIRRTYTTAARGPGVAFVNRIAMRVHLQRAVEMRALFDRTFAVILTMPLQKIVCLCRRRPSVRARCHRHRPCRGEKMSTRLVRTTTSTRTVSAATHGGVHAIERRSDRRSLRVVAGAGRDFRFRFFTHGKGRCKFVFGNSRFQKSCRQRRLRRRERKNIHRERTAGQKSSVAFNCAASSLATGSAVFAPGKRCE